MNYNINNSDTLRTVLNVCSDLGDLDIDPKMSKESLEYFDRLLNEYGRLPANQGFTKWLKNRLIKDFIALDYYPRWIQNPEWPIYEGTPMIFIGQLDIKNNERTRHYFHDDTSIYVFIDKKSPPIIVFQQY